MKRFLAIILCAILALTMLCACGAKEPEPEKENDKAVIGTWQEYYFDSGYVFNADGTGTDTFWDLTFTYTAYDGKITLIYDDELWGASQYDYVISGNVLSMTRIDTDGAETFEYTKVTETPTTAPTEAPAESEGEGESN